MSNEIPKIGDNVRLKGEPALRTYIVKKVDKDNEIVTCTYLDEHIEGQSTIFSFNQVEVIEKKDLL